MLLIKQNYTQKREDNQTKEIWPQNTFQKLVTRLNIFPFKNRLIMTYYHYIKIFFVATHWHDNYHGNELEYTKGQKNGSHTGLLLQEGNVCFRCSTVFTNLDWSLLCCRLFFLLFFFVFFVNVDYKRSWLQVQNLEVLKVQLNVTDEQLEDWVEDVKHWSQGIGFLTLWFSLLISV